MSPEYLYYALLGLLVAPSLPFNRVAVVVAIAWLPGQFSALIGASPVAIDMAVDILCIGAAMALARSTADFFVAALFVPMAITNLVWGLGAIHPYYAYWLLFALAVIQVITVPFGNDWTRIRRVFYRDDRLREREA